MLNRPQIFVVWNNMLGFSGIVMLMILFFAITLYVVDV